MIQNNEGLTDTYNRFHDPEETSPHILQLRTLHAAMDRAVLEAYGWHDLAARATCEFQLDYEEPEDEKDDAPAKRKKKKPWRYKWPQQLHDEVLARLLELNQQYAEQERLAGEAAQADASKPKPLDKAAGKKPTKKKTTSKKKATGKQIGLYPAEEGILQANDPVVETGRTGKPGIPELRAMMREKLEEKPVVVKLPLYDLEAAAGPFDEAQAVGAARIVKVLSPRKYRRQRGVSYFVARVTGRSMEPAIADGSYCVFRRPATPTKGSRVLVGRQLPEDPERGGRFVVKVYQPGRGGEPAQLVSLNPDYPPFTAGREDHIVAEWVDNVELES